MVRSGAGKSSFSIVDVLIYGVLAVLSLLTLLPLLHVFNVSLSSSQTVLASKLMLYPKEPTLESYKFIFRNDVLLRSLGITVFITVVGTFLNLLFTTIAAYVLSRRELPGVSFFLMMIVVTMLFNAGIIPGYMLIRSLGLINSVWAMILPGLISFSCAIFSGACPKGSLNQPESTEPESCAPCFKSSCLYRCRRLRRSGCFMQWAIGMSFSAVFSI
jgi:ABC-type glycerol-3-phosphate transport system permease component